MTLWLLLHVAGLGAWIGSAVADVVLEGFGRGESDRSFVARLAWPMALGVEAPALLLVGLSGVRLIAYADPNAPPVLMVGAGFLAAMAAGARILIVGARRRALLRDDKAVFQKADRLSPLLAWIVLALLAVAFLAGARDAF